MVVRLAQFPLDWMIAASGVGRLPWIPLVVRVVVSVLGFVSLRSVVRSRLVAARRQPAGEGSQG